MKNNGLHAVGGGDRTRIGQAEARAARAEARAEQAEMILQFVVNKEVELLQEISRRLPTGLPLLGTAAEKSPLERLTSRQREILRFIAMGRNTKQIAESLEVSPKTVEYHRMKLMAALDVYDIPSLVRFALRAGLLPQEGWPPNLEQHGR